MRHAPGRQQALSRPRGWGGRQLRRNTAASEFPATDPEERARTEQEFADAEAYEAKWHEEDKERYHQERLP